LYTLKPSVVDFINIRSSTFDEKPFLVNLILHTTNGIMILAHKIELPVTFQFWMQLNEIVSPDAVASFCLEHIFVGAKAQSANAPALRVCKSTLNIETNIETLKKLTLTLTLSSFSMF
jgi:hypothetical protein